MESIDYFKVFYTAIGGLGLFFLGLRYLSEGLQAITGELIRSLINAATSNRFMAVLVGIGVTALVQSSSISTVMVVGLVDAGLMSLVQAIGVILGANIGTTITGWILVVKIGKYGLLLIGLGIFPMLFSKRSKVAATGRTLLALGLIFFGLELMSQAFSPLRSSEGFISFLHLFDTRTVIGLIGCICMGCLLTFVVQSSSAMLGITIALASTGVIDFPTGAALVLGENIGTTVTALLAGLGTNVPARRAALSHACFNVTGVIIMLLIFQPYLVLIDAIVPGLPDAVTDNGEKPFIAAHIAMGHSVFNVVATLIMLPFLRHFARLIEYLIPAKEEEEIHHLRFIGTPGQVTTEVALNTAQLELHKLVDVTKKALQDTKGYLKADKQNLAKFDELSRLEVSTDTMQSEMTNYVCSVMGQRLTNEQSALAYSLIRAADELESIVDYCYSLCRYRNRMFENKLEFSTAGWNDVFDFFEKIEAMFDLVTQVLDGHDPDMRMKVPMVSDSLTRHADYLRNQHLERMSDGSCQAMPALAFSDMMVAMRRIKNHSVNLFQALEHGEGTNLRLSNA